MFGKIKLITLFLLLYGVTVCYAHPLDTLKRDTTPFVIKRGASLLYYVDNSFNSNQFLIPFIETELKLLTDKTDSLHRRLFSSVDGINYYVNTDSASNEMTLFFGTFSKIDPTVNKLIKDRNSEIFNRIKQAQYFLKININAFNNLLEYQFVLVKIEVGKGTDENFFQLGNYRTSSIFIDPNSPDYKEKIRNCLHQLISETNVAPVPVVTYDNQTIYDFEIFSAPHQLKMEANATDIDSSPDQIHYKWELRNTKSSNYTTLEGGKLQIVLGTGLYEVTLYVSDGVNIVPRKYEVQIRDNPEINFIESEIPPVFYGNTLHLYTFHSEFKNYDFSSLFTKIKSIATARYDFENWTELKHNLPIYSTVENADDISYYQVKFNKIGDSITNYRTIPLLGGSLSSAFYFQKSLVSLKDSTYGRYPVNILMRTNSEEKILAPSILYFKAVADDNGIKTPYEFNIQFSKISRLSPYLYLSTIQYNTYGNPNNFIQAGVGVECLLTQGFSINGAVGSSTSKSFSSPVTVFYKLGGDANVYNFRNIAALHLSIVSLYKQSDTYKADSTKNTYHIYYNAGYHPRLGFGGNLDVGFATSEYHPFSYTLFFMYYPVGFNLNAFTETGLTLKFSFINYH